MGNIRSFFRKRKEERELPQHQVLEQLHILTEEIQSGKNLLAALEERVKQNSADISRHDMALEDCLDMLDTWVKERAHEQKRKQASQQEREKLLQMLCTYQEQLWNMKTYAEKNDPAWHRQLLMVDKVVKEKMLSCGITAIDRTGCAVNYEFHEVTEIMPTEDASRDRTVAAIHRPGYLYRGEVGQKAQVVAYHLKKTE